MKTIFIMILAAAGVGCASDEAKMADYLNQHPEVIFNAIEKNPTRFIEVVNIAAKKAQEEKNQQLLAEMKKEQEEQIKKPLQPVIDEKRILSGKAESPITIVEYADFQCPACGMAFSSLQEVKKKYGDQLRFIYKNMPLSFHKMAMPSARYFESISLQSEALADKFYDYVFSHQQELKDEKFLDATAKKIGVNMKKLHEDLDSEKVRMQIAADQSEFEKFGFTGTPVIMINGVALYGARPPAEIEQLIERIKKN